MYLRTYSSYIATVWERLTNNPHHVLICGVIHSEYYGWFGKLTVMSLVFRYAYIPHSF